MKMFSNSVPQQDVLIGSLTAKQALMYAADMRLNATAAEKEIIVNDVIQELSLSSCANVLIGDSDKKG
jgi:ABC-type multidrug transport system ATPase subunit